MWTENIVHARPLVGLACKGSRPLLLPCILLGQNFTAPELAAALVRVPFKVLVSRHAALNATPKHVTVKVKATWVSTLNRCSKAHFGVKTDTRFKGHESAHPNRSS